MPTDDAGRLRRLIAIAAAVVPAVTFSLSANAQAVSDTFSNLSVDSDTPVKIEADQLEVFDNDKTAVFSGNVIVKQGKTTMQTSQLKVYYQGDGTSTAEGTGNRVSKLEAAGEVVVTSEGQVATGDWAVFEMATQEVRLGGKVVLSQGKNVLRGTELVVDLETGQSKLVSAQDTTGGGGRVQGLFIPGSMGQKQEKRQEQDAPADQTN